MTLEIAVLRALLKLARRRQPRQLANLRNARHASTLEQIQRRVGGDPAHVQRAVSALVRAGLVQRAAEGPRLTLPGLALATAIAVPAVRPAKAQPRARGTVALLRTSRPAPTRGRRAA